MEERSEYPPDYTEDEIAFLMEFVHKAVKVTKVMTEPIHKPWRADGQIRIFYIWIDELGNWTSEDIVSRIHTAVDMWGCDTDDPEDTYEYKMERMPFISKVYATMFRIFKRDDPRDPRKSTFGAVDEIRMIYGKPTNT